MRGTGRKAPLGVELGALDEACADLPSALADADVAIVCAPVDVLPQVTRDVLAAAPAGCAVTDVGSTKREVVAAAGADERFVGGHPLAGAEVSGVEHAREDLFDGATWYLTPQPTTSGVLLERVHRLLDRDRRAPAVVDPADHDRTMAAVSHLPHVLANVLVEQAAGALGGERMPATGPSFRDATRVAGANPRAVDRDLQLEPRGAGAPRSTRRSRACRGPRALGGDDRDALLAWQKARRRRAPRAARGRARRRPGARAARGGAQPPGVIAEIALDARPRRRQHHRHGAEPVAGQQQRRRRRCGSPSDAGRRARAELIRGLGIPVA